MPRRRLSERQVNRIQAIQERRRQRLEQQTSRVLEELEQGDELTGLVVVRHGKTLAVEDDQGLIHLCQARANIGHPVCGDRVIWQPTQSSGKQSSAEQRTGVVTALLPRDTVLSRPDYGGRDKPLAANIDLIVIVVAVRPEPSGYLVDQYLVTAQLMGIDALLLVNKTDLLDDDELGEFLARFASYDRIGYPVVPLSVKRDPALRGLMPQLSKQTAILLGQSGVGKSSLVQAMLPNREVQIGRLSEATGLGRHTTSAATCYNLHNGGRLIDSPGVRSFRLGDIDQSTLERGFKEFAPHLGRCRFSNCSHDHEPDCAIRDAVDDGDISTARLENFHALARGLRSGS